MPSLAVTVAAAAFVVAAAAGCGSGTSEKDGPLRGLPAEQGVQIVNRHAADSSVWHYGSFPVCHEGQRGGVRLERVEAKLVGDVRLTAAKAKAMTQELAGAMPGPIPEGYAPVQGFEVDQRCASDDRVELVLQFAVPQEGSSAVDGFRIHYRAGDRMYVESYAATIVFCQRRDTSASESVLAPCRKDPEQ